MGLREVLQARAAVQGRTAEVPCGELGVLTVEALPLQEAETLSRGADADRAVFYAACRELQAEGDAMHRTGKIYAPDGIMRFVSDEEAAAAARVVLELSGVQRKESPESREERLTEELGTVETAEETVAVSAEVRGEVEVERWASDFMEAAEPQEERFDDEALISSALPEQAAERKIEPMAQSGVKTLAEGTPLATEIAAEAEPFMETGLRRLAAVGSENTETLREKASAAVSAAETVWVTRETRESDAPAGLWREPSFDRRQSPVLTPDPEECFARQLLEGLRRAKWVRGE